MQQIIHRFSKSIVSYDPNTGEFRWVYCYRKPWQNGEIATHAGDKGYLYIKADGIQHSASRLAWKLYNKQEVPEDLVVDHWDRNNQNNKGKNLRAVTQAVNLANSSRPLGQSGIRGLDRYNRQSGNGFLWRVRVLGICKYFQCFGQAVGYAKLVAERCSK